MRARVCAREAGGVYEKRQVEERGNGIGADSESEKEERREYVLIAEMGEDNVNDVFALQ